MRIHLAKAVSLFFATALLTMLAACGGGGSGDASNPPTGTTPVTPTPTATGITLATSQSAVKSDNSDSATITVTAVNASNAAVSGVPVSFSVNSGFLSASSATTDATGKATITFSSGADPTTRTATVVAQSGTLTSQLPVRVSGSTLTATATSTTLSIGGAVATLTVSAKNAAGTALAGQAIGITQSGTGSVTIGATTGSTDASGNFSTTIAAATSGTVQLTVAGVGETRTLPLTVTGASSSAFQITAPANSASLAGTVGTPITVTALAPSPTTRVTLATTLGGWNSVTGASVITLTPAADRTVTAQLYVSSSGVANVQAFDPDRQSTTSDSRTISFTASCSIAARVTIQSTPSVIAVSTSGTSNISTLIATVTDGANPVGNCPVAFSIVNATGGGESVSPNVVLTAATTGNGVGLGQASTTFTSGSLPSGAGGVQIRATVVQPGVTTPLATGTASAPDATVVIGGSAGSVTIGQSTTIQDTNNSTTYVLPMSVLVADSNGNLVANATVSLSTWPIAFNVGGAICAGTAANGQLNQPGAFFYNEDINENLIRDTSNGESTAGLRTLYAAPIGTSPTSQKSTSGPLTPPNSAAGTLPATVTTGANGVATFNLTYLKSNAGYIYDRIRARTLVQGTETIGEVEFKLGYLASDVGSPCTLAPTPFN